MNDFPPSVIGFPEITRCVNFAAHSVEDVLELAKRRDDPPPNTEIVVQPSTELLIDMARRIRALEATTR